MRLLALLRPLSSRHRRLLAGARAASSSAVGQRELNLRLLNSEDPTWHFCGPLCVAAVQGKGRGLVATEPIRVGDLLLACQPLAFLQGTASAQHGSEADDEGSPPDPEGLIDQLAALVQRRPQQQHQQHQPSLAELWLRALHKGGPASTQAADVEGNLLSLTRLLHSSESGPEPLPEPPAEFAQGTTSLTRADLDSVVTFNAFGDRFDDPAAAAAALSSSSSSSAPASSSSSPSSGPATPRGLPHVGVWPHFSLLNHSCLPNAIHYTIGKTMVVRAAQRLAPGEEVLVSYLGTEDHAPAAKRRQALQERYGFRCRCPRCTLEDQLPADLTSLLLRLHAEVAEELMPAFAEAVQGGGQEKQLEQIDARLQMCFVELHTALASFVTSDMAKSFNLERGRPPGAAPERSGPAFAALVLEAGCYELFQLTSMFDEMVGEENTDSLRNCIRIMDAVSRGSELQTFLAARVLYRELQAVAAISPETGRASLKAGRHEGVRDAMVECEIAHLARYGALPKHTMQAMFKHSERVGRRFV